MATDDLYRTLGRARNWPLSWCYVSPFFFSRMLTSKSLIKCCRGNHQLQYVDTVIVVPFSRFRVMDVFKWSIFCFFSFGMGLSYTKIKSWPIAFSVPSFFSDDESNVLSRLVGLVQLSCFFLDSFFQAEMCSSNNPSRVFPFFSHDNPFARSVSQTDSQKKNQCGLVFRAHTIQDCSCG